MNVHARDPFETRIHNITPAMATSRLNHDLPVKSSLSTWSTTKPNAGLSHHYPRIGPNNFSCTRNLLAPDSSTRHNIKQNQQACYVSSQASSSHSCHDIIHARNDVIPYNKYFTM